MGAEDPGPSVGAASAVDCWAVFPALFSAFLRHVNSSVFVVSWCLSLQAAAS